jgi:hypothetical protein
MIDETTARELVVDHLGRQEFEMHERPYGWRIEEPDPAEPTRGGGTLVVERSTGKLLQFTSSIAPMVIDEAFDEVRPEAIELTDGNQ